MSANSECTPGSLKTALGGMSGSARRPKPWLLLPDSTVSGCGAGESSTLTLDEKGDSKGREARLDACFGRGEKKAGDTLMGPCAGPCARRTEQNSVVQRVE